ncbi:hypothetical protein ACHAW5_004675 [Stephanodiscus triporus]|uniref:Uncharacterized protein n=1 Tax=Stephanodiscus triporus TaxID=2934178 RepID=A0ABD3Q5E7_9STRA
MSEDHLDNILSDPNDDRSNNIYFAHARSTGGVIVGEVKLASALRILGGGTYMDMALVFDMSFNHQHKIFKYVVSKWLSHKSFYNISGVNYCCDEDKMKELHYNSLMCRKVLLMVYRGARWMDSKNQEAIEKRQRDQSKIILQPEGLLRDQWPSIC